TSSQYRIQTCQGNTRIVLLVSAYTLWQGRPAQLVNGLDMTHLDEVQHQLRESERNFRRLFEQMQDVYYRTDALGVVQHVGPGVRRVLGYEPHEIEGRTAESYYPRSEDRDAFKKAIQEFGEVSDFPGQMVRRDGQIIDISISSHALYDHTGAFAGVEGIYRDVTQRKNLERELHRMATTDMLTGLANRRAFLESAESMFLAHRRPEQALSLLMLDLDHFKAINDRFGHFEGDRALVELAEALRIELRSTDVIGRLGGEEFAVLLPDTRIDEAMAVAERILQRLRGKMLWTPDNAPAQGLTASIGATRRLPDDRHSRQWLDRADTALYQAKRQGRDRVVRAEESGAPPSPEC
ncbi:MAG: sensor domain-containing diguanylate cyclase, partial [Curvibacter sp.]|nr:sensor domain-containing diguanylate cyclase [Curvibacter sp.]